MKRHKYMGKTIEVNDADHTQLLKRFDPKNFELSPSGMSFCNYAHCPLCIVHHEYNFEDQRNDCWSCPLDKFRKGSRARLGCTALMLHIVPGRLFHMGLDTVSFMWNSHHESTKQLNKVMVFLKKWR